MHALGTMCNKATMRLEMFASPPSHLPVIVCVLTSSTLRNKLLTHLKIHATQSLSHQQSETSSPCMRLERCAIDRPCTLKCLRVASPPCPTAVIVCVLTSSRPRDIHKVTHVSWPPAGPTPVFRLRGITHEDPNTMTGDRFVWRRPGAQAPRLKVSAHAMPMSQIEKLLACAPALFRPDREAASS